MKGREAARAAERRQYELTEQLNKLKEEHATLKKLHADEVAALRAEKRTLRDSMREEATQLAAKEIARLTNEREEEYERRALCEDRLDDLAWRKDVLLYNACRYLSMSLGLDVVNALGMISTWMLDKNYDEVVTEAMMIDEGVPADGWICTNLRANQTRVKPFHNLLLRSDENSMFIALGKVEELRPSTVHPLYRAEAFAAHPDAKNRKINRPRKRDVRGSRIKKSIR